MDYEIYEGMAGAGSYEPVGGFGDAAVSQCPISTSKAGPPGVPQLSTGFTLCTPDYSSDPIASVCNQSRDPVACYFSKTNQLYNGTIYLGRGTAADAAAWQAWQPGLSGSTGSGNTVLYAAAAAAVLLIGGALYWKSKR